MPQRRRKYVVQRKLDTQLEFFLRVRGILAGTSSVGASACRPNRLCHSCALWTPFATSVFHFILQGPTVSSISSSLHPGALLPMRLT